MNRKVMIDSFRARSDAGSEYTIEVWQTMIDASSHEGHLELPGRIHLVTSCGLIVNQLDAETFQIFRTKEIIRKF